MESNFNSHSRNSKISYVPTIRNSDNIYIYTEHCIIVETRGDKRSIKHTHDIRAKNSTTSKDRIGGGVDRYRFRWKILFDGVGFSQGLLHVKD